MRAIEERGWTGDYRVGMVYEKSERAICSMGFGRTSFQQGGKVPTGYLGRFLGKGLEAFEPPGISPHLPLSHLPSPAWSPCCPTARSSFPLPLSATVLQCSYTLFLSLQPQHQCHLSEKTSLIKKASNSLLFLCSSAYFFFLMLFPDIIPLSFYWLVSPVA